MPRMDAHVGRRHTLMPLPGSSLGYSAARRLPSVSIAACACATVTPGRSRALTKNAAS